MKTYVLSKKLLLTKSLSIGIILCLLTPIVGAIEHVAPKVSGMITETQSNNTATGGLFVMPDLEAERAAYTRFGWTWAESAEPDFTEPEPSYTVVDPAIHGDTEGDDLWSYLMMYERTGQEGYLARATGWQSYFLNDYRSCVGSQSATFCSDRNGYGLDHLWGWGLISWHLKYNDTESLAEAEQIAEVVETLWGDDPETNFGCLSSRGCTGFGTRQVGRHLLFITRLAEVTGKPRWITLRDFILDRLENNPNWSQEYGMYFYGRWSTNIQLGDQNAYENGDRVASPLQIGVLTEALDQAYRITGKQWIRDQLVGIASFIKENGFDPTYRNASSLFGIVDGAIYHNYSANEPVNFWDPNNSTMLVNTLVRGYRYTCDIEFHEAARDFFIRGNGGIYGQPVQRSVPDGVVHHFVDSVFQGQGLGHVEGELQYTYLLFEDISSGNTCTTQAPGIFKNGFEIP